MNVIIFHMLVNLCSRMYNNSMQVGLSTATFFGKILTENALEKIKSLGVDIAEVFLTTFYEYEEKFINQLLLDLHGVEVYSVHSLNNHYEPELFNLVERTRADGQKIFDKVITGGSRLGAKYYTFHGPSRLKVKEYKLDYERIGIRVEELCQRAKAKGIDISYENVSWAFYNAPGFFQKLSKYSPSLKSCLDIKQAMQSYKYHNNIYGRPFSDKEIIALHKYTYEYIDDMGKSLVNVHLCDYDANGKLCVPGKGIFDFSSLIGRLRNSNYDGPLMIELYSRDYNEYSEVQDSINYIKETIRRNND